MPKLLTVALLLITAGSALAAAPATEPAPPAAAQQPAGNPGSRIVAERTPALVTIKFMLKDEEGEQEEEAAGTMIEGGGLVLCSNRPFGGLMARMGMPTPTPTDIKVLIGDDTEGVKAKFLARDTELGLAWIQIEEPAATPYTHITFDESATPGIGDRLFNVSLMGKFFHRAPMLSEGFVAATVTRPRNLIMPSISLAAGGEDGLPIFAEDGKAVGFSTLILPDREEMVGGQMQSAMKGFFGQMILPAKAVNQATANAKEMAKSNPPAADAPKADEPAPTADPAAPQTPAPAPK